MTLERLTQITSVGISSGITLSSATLTGVTTLTTLSAGGDIDAVNGTFSGNVSIAGTLTYEDVTNIDSVGVITARNTLDAQGNVTVGAGLSVVGVSSFSAVHVLSGGLEVSGVSTFGGGLSQLEVTGISTLSNTVVGGATTELVVGGDARITGILTVGESSITFNGNTNVITLGNGNIGIGSTTLITPTQVTNTGVGAELNATGTGVTWSPSGTYVGYGGTAWFDYSQGSGYIGFDTSIVLTNGATYGKIYGRSPATVTTQAEAGKFWILYVKQSDGSPAPPSSDLSVEAIAGWKFQLPYPATKGDNFDFNLVDSIESFGSPTVPSSGTYYLGWAHSEAEGEGTVDGDWWSDEDSTSRTEGNGSIYWRGDPGNIGAGISFGPGAQISGWNGRAESGGIHFRFETLPKIDLKGTILVSPNIVDPVFMGTPTLDGQEMFGGQLVYSTSWNENTTSVEYLSANFMDSIYMVSYALSGSPGWVITYMQFTDHDGTAYTGSADYNSTAEYMDNAATSPVHNTAAHADDEPGLWLSGQGSNYWHNGIYWIIPGAIRNNLGGSTYDPTKNADSSGGPWTPSIMVRGMSYLYYGASHAYYREQGGGIYKNSSDRVSGFRLIGGDNDATIGSGSSNGWVAVWRFRRTV